MQPFPCHVIILKNLGGEGKYFCDPKKSVTLCY